MLEWREYTKSLIEEGNLSNYANNVNKIQNFIYDKKDWKTIENYESLRNAAKEIISNDNSKYWTQAGQTGAPNQIKRADPNSVWSVALELASKDARGSDTEPVGTKIQRNVRKQFHINIPFLDPSSSVGLDPYWRNSPVVGALLQTAVDIFLDLDGVLYILLAFLTGGLGVVPGRVGKLFNDIHKIMNMQSVSGKGAKSAIQEIESVSRSIINKFVNSPYRTKIIIDRNTKVLKFQNILDYFLSNSLSSAESRFFANLREETIIKLEQVVSKYRV